MRGSIEDNTISVLYQPIFDVNTKRITSLDTIVRVHDAKGRTLAPYFVTAEAHRLNMSVQLTLDVLETCVKDMTAFRQVAPELDIVDICMNGSELGASIFHERLEQLTHEQPQLRFGLQLGSHAIHVAHDAVDDEVADRSDPRIRSHQRRLRKLTSTMLSLADVAVKQMPRGVCRRCVRRQANRQNVGNAYCNCRTLSGGTGLRVVSPNHPPVMRSMTAPVSGGKVTERRTWLLN